MTAEPFAELVRAHVDRWRAEHPGDERDRNEKGFYDGNPCDAPVQALVWLAAVASHIADPDQKNRTKKGDLVPVVPKGLLVNLISGKRVYLELRVADAIAIALDCPFATAGIDIFPNPNASESQRQACCSVQPEYAEDWAPLPVAV